MHQLAVHTMHGVIAPGEPIMYIVPDGDILIVKVRIAPHEIDRVHYGQTALLRFTAFDQRTTPELMGEVVLVSADVTQDAKTSASKARRWFPACRSKASSRPANGRRSPIS